MGIALLVASPLLLMGSVYLLSRIPLSPGEEALSHFEARKSRYARFVRNKKYGILIDYGLPAFMKRLWVIDLESGGTVIHTHVSHAIRSGVLFPTDLSNRPNTGKSCGGSFVTLGSYQGKYGLGMRIEGLERGVNHNARKRAIVFHPSLGRTWSAGCFMTREEINEEIIDLTKGGAFLYVHAPGHEPTH